MRFKEIVFVLCLPMLMTFLTGCGNAQPKIVEYSQTDSEAAKERYKAASAKAHGTAGTKGAK